MSHFLDGDWNVFVVTFPAGSPVVSADGSFHLSHGATNVLDNSSKHGGNDLTGSSIPDGGRFEIRFAEKVTVAGVVKFRPYTGSLMDHKLLAGNLHKVIGGFRGRLQDNALALEAEDSLTTTAAITGQNDGIWIATQP
ncbi:MAG: hypothetical protein ACRD9S_18455 [Pyrinomonadaceae bacterium]